MKRPSTIPDPLPPGWYSAPVMAWWPDFRSDLCGVGPLSMMSTARQQAMKLASIGCAQARADGRGWGSGTIPMPNTPHNLAPGWMGEKAA